MGATEVDVFVDLQATGYGNGSFWKNAYTDLQTALENAIDQGSDGDVEIWIAQGVYIPTKVDQRRPISKIIELADEMDYEKAAVLAASMLAALG
ncbi:MAG: hypothetical protein ACJATP_001536 [Candidatus Azotimanducaceae bacterium]|jgi:hypothetical protein